MAPKRKIKPKQSRKTSAVSAHCTQESGNPVVAIQKPVVTVASLPFEVLECILAVDGNANTLKRWRLVSRSWNEACCRLLRKTAAVPINEGKGSYDLVMLNHFLVDRQFRFPPDWPNPFQNYKILEASTIALSLFRFVQRPTVKITTLEILQDEGFEPLLFERILEEIKGELIHLKIRGKNSDAVPFLTMTEKLRNGGWNSLKFLTLRDTCSASSLKPCSHLEFLIALKPSLNLEEVELTGDYVNVIKIFSETDQWCWDKLLRLDLECRSTPSSNLTPEQTHELIKWAEEIPFPPLTHLTLWFTGSPNEVGQISEQYTPRFLPLIQRSSQVIKDLRVNFLPMSLLPSHLPQLMHLSVAVMDGEGIQDITEDNFPSLTSVYCILHWTEIPTYREPNKDFGKNRNIGKLTVFWGTEVPRVVTQELLWAILRDHFPNLKTLKIQPSVSSLALHSIRKRLPQLQRLELSSAASSELLGTSSGPPLTAKGWPCQAYFENCAFLEMPNLTELILEKSVLVSNDVICACLGKLPAIRLLYFVWNNSLEPAHVREHLAHIQELRIQYKDEQERKKLEKLTKTMKGLTLVKD